MVGMRGVGKWGSLGTRKGKGTYWVHPSFSILPRRDVSDICRRGHAAGSFLYRGLSREYSSPCRPVSQLFNLVVVPWKQSLTIHKKCGGLFSSKTLLKKQEADCMWPMSCRQLTPGMRAGVPPPHGLPRAEPPRWFCHSKIWPQKTDGKASIRAHLNSEKKNLRSIGASVIIEF